MIYSCVGCRWSWFKAANRTMKSLIGCRCRSRRPILNDICNTSIIAARDKVSQTYLVVGHLPIGAITIHTCVSIFSFATSRRYVTRRGLSALLITRLGSITMFQSLHKKIKMTEIAVVIAWIAMRWIVLISSIKEELMRLLPLPATMRVMLRLVAL